MKSMLMTVGALMLVMAPGCAQGDPAGLDSLTGTYEYVASLEDGSVVVRGEIELWMGEAPLGGTGQRRLEGTWSTELVGPAGANVGPQVGSGTAVGWLLGSEFTLQLNPEMADNNVGLSGRVDGRSIGGRWGYSTLIGEVAAGSFVMVRR